MVEDFKAGEKGEKVSQLFAWQKILAGRLFPDRPRTPSTHRAHRTQPATHRGYVTLLIGPVLLRDNGRLTKHLHKPS